MGRASKDKRDIFYRLAKEEGWRARSAYKLIHINQTFNIFENVTKAVDLCAAPGSWSQVLAQTLPKSEETRIVAVDLQTMAPIPGVVCLKGDITRESTAHQIIANLGDSKAELVVCDGAPDVIGFHQLDEYFQSQLVLAALNIGISVLQPGGTFVAKFFRASPQGVRSTFLRFKVFFEDVVLSKPRSSRVSSIECFIVARKFRLPVGFAAGSYNSFNRYNTLIGEEVLAKVNKLHEDVKIGPGFRFIPPKNPYETKPGEAPYEETEAYKFRYDPCGNVSHFTRTPCTSTREELLNKHCLNPDRAEGEAPIVEMKSLTMSEFIELSRVDQEAEDQIWLDYLKGFPELQGKELPEGFWPPNARRKPIKLLVDWEGEPEAEKDPALLYVPCVTSGDLNGFDSDTTYTVPEDHKSLPPVQSPITPPYAEAVAKRKENLAKGEGRKRSEFRYFNEANGMVVNRLHTTDIHLSFGGGAEKLVGNLKTHTAQVKVELTKKVTLAILIEWIKENLIVERPELLFLDGDVRPGILMLVNDMDYELLDKGLKHELSMNDKVAFISTLHGG